MIVKEHIEQLRRIRALAEEILDDQGHAELIMRIDHLMEDLAERREEEVKRIAKYQRRTIYDGKAIAGGTFERGE